MYDLYAFMAYLFVPCVRISLFGFIIFHSVGILHLVYVSVSGHLCFPFGCAEWG